MQLRSTTKSEAWAWPALWKTAVWHLQYPCKTECILSQGVRYPGSYSSKPESQKSMLEVSTSQTIMQYNYFTTIIKMLLKYILYFIRGQSTVLTFPFHKVRQHSLLTWQDRFLNLYLPIFSHSFPHLIFPVQLVCSTQYPFIFYPISLFLPCLLLLHCL